MNKGELMFFLLKKKREHGRRTWHMYQEVPRNSNGDNSFDYSVRYLRI